MFINAGTTMKMIANALITVYFSFSIKFNASTWDCVITGEKIYKPMEKPIFESLWFKKLANWVGKLGRQQIA